MLKNYLEELKKIKLLSLEEERDLWQRRADGDAEAHHKIITAYQPLVFKVAMSFSLPETQLREIIQEGTVGLLEAAEQFDYTKGVAFSLYAVHRVRGRMLDFLARERGKSTLSLDSETSIGSGVSWSECLVSGGLTPSEAAEQHFISDKVMEAMDRLTVNEQKVLSGIYLQDKSASDLASDINVTTSHIYRIQKKAVKRVRGMLSRFIADLKQ
ncbi:MAG TPA: sigma-70 family RNA polymerase sigma factor [Candidatus Avacidaminococcus intestinavium]|uniref:RNA polymerase sigma factor n=1 Tax=Candidatus Avacidaminococcus intestinavium TaxID=2840684 RepID=A0A9D1SL71_9FIRM|nr:sigma-70 family RNA polymerase sigma factor [Candidatus Avacidaminococcus intestinavium]